MSDDYTAIQRRLDDQYSAEWERWWSSLPKDEQDKMAGLGLDKPVSNGRSYATGQEHDAAGDAQEPWEEPLVAQEPKPVAAPPNPDEKVQDAIRVVVSGIVSSQNIRVDAIALAFAAGLTICSMWGSQSEAARQFGIMRQHLNKAVRKWRDLLELPPNPYTASEKRRKKLSVAQTKKHWRKR